MKRLHVQASAVASGRKNEIQGRKKKVPRSRDASAEFEPIVGRAGDELFLDQAHKMPPHMPAQRNKQSKFIYKLLRFESVASA